MTTIEQNKHAVQRHFQEVLNQGLLDVADELYAPEYVLHAPVGAGDTVGPEQLKQRAAAFRTGFPNIVFSVDQMVAEGNTVTARYTYRGTHTGKFGPYEPTGNPIIVPGIIVLVFNDEGKIHEGWSAFDSLNMFKQMGVM